MSDFDMFYSNNPWAGLQTNQRPWYVPFLREIYLRDQVYSRFVTTQFAMLGPGSPIATKMTLTSLIPPHANFDPISLRQLWMPSSYVDSFSREIEFRRYGGKMALHKYDQMITYWQLNGQKGLLPIINRYLGGMMTETMDMQARNAFFEAPYTRYGDGGADFSDIDSWSSHKFTTSLIDACASVWRSAACRSRSCRTSRSPAPSRSASPPPVCCTTSSTKRAARVLRTSSST